MKAKLLPCLILLLFILGSCHTKTDDYISKYCPGSCTVIKGKLTTDDRSKPLAGVMLEAKWVERDMLGFSSTTRRKATARTDANGNYELRFLLRDDELPQEYNYGNIIVEAHLDTKDYLICSGTNELFYSNDLVRDTTIEVNYNLPKKATINLQATNLETMQPTDNLYTGINSDAGDATKENDCVGGIIWSKYQSYYSLDVAANQDLTIRVVKNKAGIETVTEEIVRLKPGEKLHYQITF